MKVKIYGQSDDLLDVEGDIDEEFNPESDELSYLAFGDGTVLSVEYGKGGIWRLNRVATGSASYSKTEGTDADDDYSDTVLLDGDLKYVVFGRQFVGPR